MCSATVKSKVVEDPALACLAFESARGVECIHSIEECALDVIRTKTDLALLGDLNGRAAVCYLSRPALVAVLQDECIHAKEIVLFKALERWLRGQDGSSAGKRLRPEGQELAALIRLPAISPTSLRDEVIPSGIYTTEQMFLAYQEQAIASECTHKVKFCTRRAALPAWRDSNSTLIVCNDPHRSVQLLNTELVTGTKYQWKLEIVKLSRPHWVGVARSNAEFNTANWLGGIQADGWAYGSDGVLIHADKYCNPLAPPYNEGDVLLMELDLREGTGGRLSANGQTLFTGMFSDSRNESFVPALCLKSPGSVRLVEFSKQL